MMNGMPLVKVLILLAFGLFAGGACAAISDTRGNMATPKDKDDWTGDQIQIKSMLGGFKEADSASTNKNNEYIAPAFLRFDVSDDNGISIVVTPRDQLVRDKSNKDKILINPSKTQHLYDWFNFTAPYPYLDNVPVNVKEEQLVMPYVAYTISKSAVEKVRYTKYGWSFGAILVPFKYQSKSKEVVSSNSYQAYLQYKRQSNGLADGPFISGGVATADVPTGAGTSSSKFGVSYGAGWIFDVRKGSGFQLSIMMGQDIFGKNSGYQYDKETWYTFSLGYRLGDENSSANTPSESAAQ